MTEAIRQAEPISRAAPAPEQAARPAANRREPSVKPPLRTLPIRITKVQEESAHALDLRALAGSDDQSVFASRVREALASPLFLDLFDEPVSINRTLIRVCGDIASAALLTHFTQRLWNASGPLMLNGEPVHLANALDVQGRLWCITSVDELMEVTGLTAAELKRARRKLVALSLVIEGGVRRCPHALAFSLNSRALDRATTNSAVRRYLTSLDLDAEDIASYGLAVLKDVEGETSPRAPRNVLEPLDVIEAITPSGKRRSRRQP
jgi:hypothetical protein